MSIHIQGFPGKHYCPRMATMNKPAYAAIREYSPLKPALIFVSSRRQTRLTALDLISYCAADDDPKHFLHMPEEEIAVIAETIRDKALRDTIVFGVAIHHAGLDNSDRKTVEELFYTGKIQVIFFRLLTALYVCMFVSIYACMFAGLFVCSRFLHCDDNDCAVLCLFSPRSRAFDWVGAGLHKHVGMGSELALSLGDREGNRVL